MASLNKVELIGHLGRDPEVRYSPDGAAIANVSLATSESWKDKGSGERREKTEWHRIAVFGPLAEVVGKHLRKGSQVYFEGKLVTRKWQDKDTGADRYTTEIHVDPFNGRMLMLGGKPDNDNGGQGGGHDDAPRQQRQAPAQRPAPQSPPAGGANLADMDDDIPF